MITAADSTLLEKILEVFESLPGFISLITAPVIIPIFIAALIAKYKLFEKHGVQGWKALIPFYSDYVLSTEVSQFGIWWFFVLFVSGILRINNVANAIIITKLMLCSNKPDDLIIAGPLAVIDANLAYAYLGFGNYHPIFENVSSLENEPQSNNNPSQRNVIKAKGKPSSKKK